MAYICVDYREQFCFVFLLLHQVLNVMIATTGTDSEKDGGGGGERRLPGHFRESGLAKLHCRGGWGFD